MSAAAVSEWRGQSPESRAAARDFNRSIQRLEQHNTAKEGYSRILGYNEIIPEVLNAVDAAVELQQASTAPDALWRTHQRLRVAYAEGAEALTRYPHSHELAVPFLNGYIEQTQELVKLQAKGGTVFPANDAE